jgi:hypothetical protein
MQAYVRFGMIRKRGWRATVLGAVFHVERLVTEVVFLHHDES